MKRILIIDDQKLFANGFKSILEDIEEVEVIEILPDGSDAVIRINALEPDIVF